MYNHLQSLVKKYQKLLAAANKLKCGKKVKSSIMGTLNRLRGSLNRYYNWMVQQGKQPKNKDFYISQPFWSKPPVSWVLLNI
ncbi:hypothetical protein EKK58_11120 [Candidatus Dependentiae bacterium]|nr:MAG: hypothetical protein EKK58_11120 [Candidatus Dependentiae bacterium]